MSCKLKLKMGLDLTLLAIPNKASIIIDKAKKSNYYATDIDKIQDPNELRQHLSMVQRDPTEKAFENSLTELIKDSEFLVSLYPDNKREKYMFSSRTRGYNTIHHLLQHYLQHTPQEEHFSNNTFYSGIDIDFAKQHTKLEYIDTIKAAKMSDLLNSIEFDQLLNYYDYEQMKSYVYKLTTPENLNSLKEEFIELQKFYLSAKTLGAFIIAKIS